MVKALITALCSLAIIISASFLEQYYLNNTFKEFERAVSITYEKTENHTAVKDDVLSIQNLWVEKKKSLHIFIPHNDIREIDLWVSEAVTLVENKKWEDALSKLEVVLEMIEQIPKTYSLKVENIL
jgi:hypothetical protein